MRVALLAHDKFPERAKTTVGILRYGEQEVVAVLDRSTAGRRVNEVLPGVQDAPIVENMEAVDEPIDALIIGIAPIGGGFDESWRPDVRAALERGSDVYAGLHYFLSEDNEFSELAAEYGCELWDVRKPPDEVTVAEGVANEVPADVILTVGTDCSTGKMTTTMELMRTAIDQGIDAAVIPTGQTGILIENWGIGIDRVISDFAAGATEQMILEKGYDHDLLIVEGQGSIIHPAYSGVTLSLLHGSMPDGLVLCHVEGRTAIHGYEDTPIPSFATYVDLYESLAAPVHEASVLAGALGTHHVENESDAKQAIEAYSDGIGVPATDPVRFGAAEILTAILDR